MLVLRLLGQHQRPEEKITGISLLFFKEQKTLCGSSDGLNPQHQLTFTCEHSFRFSGNFSRYALCTLGAKLRLSYLAVEKTSKGHYPCGRIILQSSIRVINRCCFRIVPTLPAKGGQLKLMLL